MHVDMYVLYCFLVHEFVKLVKLKPAASNLRKIAGGNSIEYHHL
jgi:hypothetical protein